MTVQYGDGGRLIGSVGTTTSSSANKFVPIASKTSMYTAGQNTNLSVGDATHQTLTYKVQHSANLKSGFFRLVYANWHSSDTDGPNDITIGASIEDGNNNTIYPVTFNGQKKITLNPGSTIVSDPVAVFFNQGDTFYTRNYVSVAAGQKYPIGLSMDNANEGSGQGDLTASGSFTFVNEPAYHPIAIFGIADQSANVNASSGLVVLGDSISMGWNPTATAWNSYAQLAGKTFNRGILSLALPGEQANEFVSSTASKYRMALPQYATHAFLYYGTNDFGFSGTVIRLQRDILAIANKLVQLGIKVYIGTLVPRASSTDAFATTINQTTNANNALRLTYNAWVRTKPAPFTDYLDLADMVESARDSGLWKPKCTNDGLHPSDAGYAAMSSIFDINKIFAGTALPQTPSLPLGVLAKPANTSVGLTWSPVSGANGYNIYRNGVKVNGSVITTTYYSDNGLTNGTAYSYQIKCADSFGAEFSSSPAVSATPAVPTAFVYDSFTRADSNTAIGSTESGTAGVKAWTVLSGTAGIISNQAYFPTAGVAVVNSAVANCSVEVRLPYVFQVNPKLVFRLTDINNYWVIQPNGTKYEFVKKVAGANTVVSYGSIKPQPGDVIKVTLSGNTIRVFINNVEDTVAGGFTDSFNATATSHGIENPYDTNVRFDEFMVY